MNVVNAASIMLWCRYYAHCFVKSLPSADRGKPDRHCGWLQSSCFFPMGSCRAIRVPRRPAVRYLMLLLLVVAVLLLLVVAVLPPFLRGHSVNKSEQCPVVHRYSLSHSPGRTPGGSPSRRRPVVLELSFAGHEAHCVDAVPTASDFNAAADGSASLVNVTYRTCCRGRVGGGSNRTWCATAARPLLVPASAAAAALATGDGAIDKLETLDVSSLVFVTAASADHYSESLELLRSIQRYFPCARVVYWDLGLGVEQAADVAVVCGVAYRRFDFTKYPPHVASLKTYAFKPLAIMETFAAGYSAIWWADASIRFESSRVDRVLELAKQRHGLVLFREPTHSVWATTHMQTYDYIATNEEGLKRTVTAPGTSFVAVNTPELFATVLFWLYLCSLDERCIAPVSRPEQCLSSVHDQPDVFGDCHRFDQSVLTMLAANAWGFGSDGYRYQQQEFSIRRFEEGENRDVVSGGGLQRCRDDGAATAAAGSSSAMRGRVSERLDAVKPDGIK